MGALLSLAVVGVAGCSELGFPRYADESPPPTARTARTRAPDEVLMVLPEVHGLEATSWSGRGPSENFRVLIAGDEHPMRSVERLPDDARVQSIGDVRTDDVELDDEHMLAMRCGWGYVDRTAMGGARKSPCTERIPETDHASMRQDVDDVLLALRARGAADGADVIDEVRCYGLTAGTNHFYCEGRAEVRDPTAPAKIDDE